MAYTISVQETQSVEGLVEYSKLLHFVGIFVDTCLENGATVEHLWDAFRVILQEKEPQYLDTAALSYGVIERGDR